MNRQNAADWVTITEQPGGRASRDQLRMMYTRYHLAASCSAGKDVLEVGCGTGFGLGYIATVAKSAVGGDIEEANCVVARKSYADHPRVGIQRFDAQRLPFPPDSFDVVIAYEMLYYLPDAEAFLQEARRVLRPKGKLLISTVNCQWDGFNPSPFSTKYLNASEITEILKTHGFQAALLGGFPDSTGNPIRSLVAAVRRVAVKLDLIPKTMEGKEWLKGLFYGGLAPIPHQLTEGLTTPEPLVALPEIKALRRYRMLYAVATVP